MGLSGSKNKKQTGKTSNVSKPVSKPKIAKTPPSKPKNLSSKFKKTESGAQAKVTSKERLREIAKENISDTVKKVTGKRDGGPSVDNTTKSVEVPTPKPFTNPLKTAINKIPSKLEKGVKNFKTNVKKALVDPAIKAGKAYAAGNIPLTTPNLVNKFKKRKEEALKNVKKRVAKKNIEKVVKDVTGKKMGGRAIPEGPKGAGLRALKAEAPEITSKMGFKKKGGIVAGINNIKGMKQGGQCRGMGAASRGGGFNVS